MSNKHYDITIIGTGMVGLSIASLLAKHNFSIAIIESKIPELNWQPNELTARVSAIHQTSRRLFDYIDVWNNINPIAYAQLKKMHVWDYAGAQIDFDSDDIDAEQMGWIVENRAIVKALWEDLHLKDNVTFFCPNTTTDLKLKNDIAILTLDDHTQIKTNLVVGADGAHSWLRQQMPITLEKRPYYHKAIIAVIESEKPHNNCAYQKFLATGPVALLPASNSNHTTLVWSAETALSDELIKKSDHDFSEALAHALDYYLGKLTVISQRAQFPLIMRHANDYVSDRCALIGDAAHTIHPLAGLGANLGFMDAACLAQTLIDARDAKKDIGALRTLRRYTRWRKSDNIATMLAMRGLRNIFGANETVMNTVRSTGVNTINQCHFAKNNIMRMAMGESEDLPSFLQLSTGG